MRLPRSKAALLVPPLLAVAAGVTIRSLTPTRQVVLQPEEQSSEYVLVYIGSAACGAARIPGFPEAVEGLKNYWATRAAEEGRGFVAVGVALDHDLDVATDFLARHGAFDQTVIGGGWLNLGAVRYVWADIPGEAAIPQLLLLSREVERGDLSIQVGEEVVHARRIGAREIMAWGTVLAIP